MVHLIKEIFSFSSAIQNATLWDCILLALLGVIAILEILFIFGLIGYGLYSFGEYIAERRGKQNEK